MLTLLCLAQKGRLQIDIFVFEVRLNFLFQLSRACSLIYPEVDEGLNSKITSDAILRTVIGTPSLFLHNIYRTESQCLLSLFHLLFSSLVLYRKFCSFFFCFKKLFHMNECRCSVRSFMGFLPVQININRKWTDFVPYCPGGGQVPFNN